MSHWVTQCKTDIFSRARAITFSKLKKKYADLDITQEYAVNAPTNFPTIYVHFLGASERGNDLEGTGINGISLTVELETIVTKAQGMEVAEEVAMTVLEAFKTMSFIVTLPEYQDSTTDTIRYISRCTRVIGANDTI